MDFAVMICRGSKAEHRYRMVVHARRSSRAFPKKSDMTMLWWIRRVPVKKPVSEIVFGGSV
jgi:hypothetical protein